MRYPARLAHLATRAIVVAKLAPTFADAHQLDHDEAAYRLGAALSGPLLDDLLAATGRRSSGARRSWTRRVCWRRSPGACGTGPSARAAPHRSTPDLSAFLLLADLAAGTASDAAGRVMETDAGKARARAGLAAVGQLLAHELTR